MDSMKTLTAADIIGIKDIAVEPVDVPEWGGRVFVRSLSATDREKYIESIREVVGKGKHASVRIILAESAAKLAQKTICDENGTLLFDEGQIAMLGQKSSKALTRCVDAAAKLNGLSDEAEDDAKNS